MYNPFKCAGCEEEFEPNQPYWMFYDENGDLFYLDEFCKDAYLADQKRQYAPVDYSDERM